LGKYTKQRMDGWIVSFSEGAASQLNLTAMVHIVLKLRTHWFQQLIPRLMHLTVPNRWENGALKTQLTSEIVLKWYGQKILLLPVVWCWCCHYYWWPLANVDSYQLSYWRWCLKHPIMLIGPFPTQDASTRIITCLVAGPSLPLLSTIIKGQVGVSLTVYPWYLLCSLPILRDYNPYLPPM